MRVALLFPPGWIPYAPYAALPRLTAYLRQKGHDVVQRDLNLEMFDTMLRAEYLQASLDRLRQDLAYVPKSDTHPLWAVESQGDYLVSQVESLTDFVRSEAFYGDPITTVRSIQLLNACLRLAVAPNYPARCMLHGSDLMVTEGTSTDHIKQAIYDERVNFTRPLMREHFIESILETQPDLLGISCTAYAQIVTGLTLAQLVKERRPDTHIVLGGGSATRLADAFVRHWDRFSDVFDTIIVGEGELALEALVEALQGQRSFEQVPGLMYQLDDGSVCRNPVELPNLSALPTPDFDGLPLDKYLSPVLLLPIASSRGCHWAKCAFCDRGIGGETTYQFRKNELVIEDIRQLQAKYHTRYFDVVEEDMPPPRLEKLAHMILEAGLDIHWSAMERLDNRMTADLCETIHRAGCRMLHFGLESGTPRVLDLINKGISLEDAAQVLRNSAQAGIWNECFVIVGFPTEEPQEVQNTLDFIRNNRESIHAIESFPFYLSKYSLVAKRPEEFSVEIVEQSDDLAFMWCYDYVARRGMTMEETAEKIKEFWHELERIYPHQGLWGTLSWEHFFLYLSERGLDFIETANLRPVFGENGWQNRKVNLRRGVMARPTDKAVVFQDVATSKRYSLKPAAFRFLELCQTGVTVGEAIQTIAQQENLDPELVAESCLLVLKKLALEGSICWVEER